jgi:hypothetical protein
MAQRGGYTTGRCCWKEGEKVGRERDDGERDRAHVAVVERDGDG